MDLSEMLKEVKQMRVENYKIMEELNKLDESKMDYPEFQSLKKSIPRKLIFLGISKSSIQIDFDLYNFNDGSKKSEEFDGLNKVSVFVQDNVIEKTVTDDVIKVLFDVFKGRTNLEVENFWTDIEIPFKMNICAEEVVISPKEGKHAKYLANLVKHVETVIVKDLDSTSDLSYDFADHPYVSEHFATICTKKMNLYFRNDTSQCEEIIRTWISRFGNSNFMEFRINWLNLVFGKIREDATINRIFNSLLQQGFIRVSDEELYLPMGRFKEIRLTIEENNGFLSGDFCNYCRFTRFLCLQVVRRSRRAV